MSGRSQTSRGHYLPIQGRLVAYHALPHTLGHWTLTRTTFLRPSKLIKQFSTMKTVMDWR
ncbi:hypothetical protein CKO15_09465 [Halorhodospira abdelmalekii]|nr:hypothetical protein [Halorhodospira abdelmalekii]